MYRRLKMKVDDFTLKQIVIDGLKAQGFIDKEHKKVALNIEANDWTSFFILEEQKPFTKRIVNHLSYRFKQDHPNADTDNLYLKNGNKYVNINETVEDMHQFTKRIPIHEIEFTLETEEFGHDEIYDNM